MDQFGRPTQSQFLQGVGHVPVTWVGEPPASQPTTPQESQQPYQPPQFNFPAVQNPTPPAPIVVTPSMPSAPAPQYSLQQSSVQYPQMRPSDIRGF